MKRIYTSALFCMFAIAAFAQQNIVFNETRPVALRYAYNNAQGPSGESVKRMLKIVSPRDYASAMFELAYTLRLQVVDLGGNRYEGVVSITGVSTSGVPMLQGFEFYQSFVPEKVSFLAELRRGGTVVKSQPGSYVPIERNAIRDNRFTFQDSLPNQTYTLSIAGLEFNYTNENENRVRRRADAIQQYGKAVTDLNKIGGDLSTMNAVNPNPDDVMPMADALTNMERTYNGILNSPFWADLELNQAYGPDPLNIKPLSARLGQDIAAKKAMINGQLNLLHELFYQRALDLVGRKDYRGAMREADKSIKARPNYAPAHYLIAFIDFEERRYDKVEPRLLDVVNNFAPDNDLRGKAFALASDLRKVRFAEGDKLVQDKKFVDAIRVYEQSRDYTSKLRGYPREDALFNDAIANARMGQFNDLVQKAQNSYSNRDYTLTLQQIDDAAAFLRQNNLRSDYDLSGFRKTVLKDAMKARLAQAKTDLDARRLPESRKALKDAEQWYSLYRQDLGDDQGLGAMQQNVYAAVLKTANENMNGQIANLAKMRQDKRLDAGLDAAEQALAAQAEAARDYESYRTYTNGDQGLAEARQKIFMEKFQILTALSERELAGKKLDAALDFAKRAEACAKENRLEGNKVGDPSALTYRVQRAIYDQLVADGEALTTQGKRQDALAKYNRAEELNRQYNFTAKGAAGVGDKINNAAVSEITTKVDDLLRGEPDNAVLKKEIDNINAFASQYNVASNSSVLNALDRIRERICYNAEHKLYKGAMDRMDEAIRRLDYVAARSSLKEAEDLLREYSGCRIDNSRYAAAKDYVNACAEYQDVLASAKGNERNRDYSRALTGYEEAAKLYKNALVSSKLPADATNDLYNYLLASLDGELQFAGARLLSDRNDIDGSLELLKRALGHRVNPKNTALIQTRLGKAFAEKLHAPGLDYKAACLTIVPKEYSKAMKTFQKEFKKRWKQLS